MIRPGQLNLLPLRYVAALWNWRERDTLTPAQVGRILHGAQQKLARNLALVLGLPVRPRRIPPSRQPKPRRQPMAGRKWDWQRDEYLRRRDELLRRRRAEVSS